MKYCHKCGSEIFDEAVICVHCGVKQNVNNKVDNSQKTSDAPLKGSFIGFLITFVGGILGLILSVCLGDDKCKKSSIITFCICLGLTILIWVLYIIFIISMAASGYIG